VDASPPPVTVVIGVAGLLVGNWSATFGQGWLSRRTWVTDRRSAAYNDLLLDVYKGTRYMALLTDERVRAKPQAIVAGLAENTVPFAVVDQRLANAILFGSAAMKLHAEAWWSFRDHMTTLAMQLSPAQHEQPSAEDLQLLRVITRMLPAARRIGRAIERQARLELQPWEVSAPQRAWHWARRWFGRYRPPSVATIAKQIDASGGSEFPDLP
jgi:hypothetical protein